MNASCAVALFLVIALPACGQQSFDEKLKSLYRHTVPLVGAEEIVGKRLQDVVLLDTRSPEEYRVSHIPGARFVHYEQFDEEDVSGIPKDAEVVIYCSVGYRSERIGEKMMRMGYQDVKNLYGGIFDWKNRGYEVVNQNKVSTDSVHTYNKEWSQWLHNGIKVYE